MDRPDYEGGNEIAHCLCDLLSGKDWGAIHINDKSLGSLTPANTTYSSPVWAIPAEAVQQYHNA